MPFPIQFLELVVFLSVSYIGVCARAYTHVSGEDWPGFYGGNLDPNQALCAHPSSAFSRRRTWGGGERISEPPFLYLCSETKEEKALP